MPSFQTIIGIHAAADDCFILAISNHGGKNVSSSKEVKIIPIEDNVDNENDEDMEIVESGTVKC